MPSLEVLSSIWNIFKGFKSRWKNPMSLKSAIKEIRFQTVWKVALVVFYCSFLPPQI